MIKLIQTTYFLDLENKTVMCKMQEDIQNRVYFHELELTEVELLSNAQIHNRDDWNTFDCAELSSRIIGQEVVI